jgi:Membrane protein involved in the export of O-antigen and teichoic acid
MIDLKYIFLSGSERSRLIKKNILGSLGLKCINILISFFLIPLTIGFVTNELYGVWLTISSVVGWIVFFDIGFGNGLRNRVAESMSKGDYIKSQQYVSTTYLSLTMIFIPLAIILYVISNFINWSTILNVNQVMNIEITKTVQIVLIFFCFTIIAKIQGTLLLALQLNALSSLMDTIGQLLILITIIILKYTVHGTLGTLALILNVCPLFVYLLSFFWIYCCKFPKLRPTFKSIKFSLVNDILSLGIKFFIIQIACLVLYGTINVIISYVSSPEYVTEYNVVYKYLGIPLMIFSILVAPLWSAYTDAFAKKDYIWMQNVYNKMFNILLLCIVFVLLLLPVYPIFFKAWLGNKVTIHLSMVLAVSFYVITTIWNTLHSNIINGLGKIRLQLYTSIVATILNIPVALWLGRLFGAEGVVMSVSLFNLIPMIILTIQTKKIIRNKAIGIWNT